MRQRYKLFLLSLVAILLSIGTYVRLTDVSISPTTTPQPWWPIQSIDTMKYSRDLAREKKNDPTFDAVIDAQMATIRDTGANYVAIATPYDDEFIPILSRWVTSARTHNLHVWFRGNFSGWEGWFEYPKISRNQHLEKLTTFISNHRGLFAPGDIFTSCPECENGGPGDPRKNGDVSGHRKFLIEEYTAANAAFQSLGVGVLVGYYSMNFDVASLIMDKETTKALGGIVTIDHYVQKPSQFSSDIRRLAVQSGGRIFLGEFGAPIPDINGAMNAKEQAAWIDESLQTLSAEKELLGVNYWVNVGGSTELWDSEGNPSDGAFVLRAYFTPHIVQGKITNQWGRPVSSVTVSGISHTTVSDRNGFYAVPMPPERAKLTFTKQGYESVEFVGAYNDQPVSITLMKKEKTLIDTIWHIFSLH